MWVQFTERFNPCQKNLFWQRFRAACGDGEFWPRTLSTAWVFLKLCSPCPGVLKSKCTTSACDVDQLREEVPRERALQIRGVTPPGSLRATRVVLQNCRWQMLWHQVSHRCGDISAPAVTVGRALGMWKYTRVFCSYFPPPPFKYQDYLKRSDRFFVRNGLCVCSSKPKCVPSDVSDSTRFQVTPWAPPATSGCSSSLCRQLCLPGVLLSMCLTQVQREAVPSLHCLQEGEKARQSSAWSCQLRLIKTSLQIRLSPCVLVLSGFPKPTENITTVSVGQRDNEEFQVAQGS